MSQMMSAVPGIGPDVFGQIGDRSRFGMDELPLQILRSQRSQETDPALMQRLQQRRRHETEFKAR